MPGRAVQILKKDAKGKFRFHSDCLTEIVDREDIRDKKVAIISAAGDFRSGKSFLLSYMLTLLFPNDTTDGDRSRSNTIKGFDFVHRAKGYTEGIWIWSEPVMRKGESGAEIAVFLMDCEGASNIGNTIVHDATVFAMSIMLSSVQIYNIKGVTSESNMQNFEIFSEIAGKSVDKAGKRPFQRLIFLNRDFHYPDEYPYGFEGGNKYISEILGDTTNTVRESFQEVDCFLMPKPGEKIQNRDHDHECSVSELDPIFVEQFRALVDGLYKDLERAKNINGMDLKACDLPTVIQEFLVMLEQRTNKTLPENSLLRMGKRINYDRTKLQILRNIWEHALVEMGKQNILSKTDIYMLFTNRVEIELQNIEDFDIEQELKDDRDFLERVDELHLEIINMATSLSNSARLKFKNDVDNHMRELFRENKPLDTEEIAQIPGNLLNRAIESGCLRQSQVDSDLEAWLEDVTGHWKRCNENLKTKQEEMEQLKLSKIVAEFRNIVKLKFEDGNPTDNNEIYDSISECLDMFTEGETLEIRKKIHDLLKDEAQIWLDRNAKLIDVVERKIKSEFRSFVNEMLGRKKHVKEDDVQGSSHRFLMKKVEAGMIQQHQMADDFYLEMVDLETAWADRNEKLAKKFRDTYLSNLKPFIKKSLKGEHLSLKQKVRNAPEKFLAEWQEDKEREWEDWMMDAELKRQIEEIVEKGIKHVDKRFTKKIKVGLGAAAAGSDAGGSIAGLIPVKGPVPIVIGAAGHVLGGAFKVAGEFVDDDDDIDWK